METQQLTRSPASLVLAGPEAPARHVASWLIDADLVEEVQSVLTSSYGEGSGPTRPTGLNPDLSRLMLMESGAEAVLDSWPVSDFNTTMSEITQRVGEAPVESLGGVLICS